ncbi:MAG: hypothetical protein V4525_16125 [Pseudomonadota bacterium]
MADTLKIIRSLEQVSTGYTVFERDQVLTEQQLNGLSSYLDDQSRLTRVELLGVGIVGGLNVKLEGSKVKVSKGVGITTDGDLLVRTVDSTFDRIKPYDKTAPVYLPFYTSAETMMEVFELVREGESDVRAQAMTTLPGALADRVVVMLMESYEKDPDLCSGTDCDNLGKDALHTPRLLLVSRDNAKLLLTQVATYSKAALTLSEIVADRPQLAGSITNMAALATLYRNASSNIHTNLMNNIGQLYTKLPVLLGEVMNGNPTVGWVNRLVTLKNTFAAQDAGIQYYYDFLKDVAETWNSLVEHAFYDRSVLCPDITAFPKHLVLGDLSNPGQLRTELYPSPLISNATEVRDYVRFLMRKLNTLIQTFQVPADTAISITPSRSELFPLEDRAIPFYYAFKGELPIHSVWNFALSQRTAHNRNFGYRAAQYGGSVRALNPLNYQIGAFDFFRIEGHIGQNIDTVMNALEAQIINRNLPFTVCSILLHTDRAKLKRLPKIRYNDLHRIHKLVRSELDSEMVRADVFSKEYKQRIKSAALNGQIPNDTAKLTRADTYDATITDATAKSRQALSKKRYSEFKADATWSTQHDTAIKTAGTFKQDFGDVSRTDYVTAFDTAIVSNHKNWLDWLDILISDKDTKANDRFLFTQFLKSHSGLEHAGGVLRGGTFVVAYDESAKVIADFMLPYRWVEEVEDEPEEPTFTYTPPTSIKEGFVMVKPIEWQFETLKGGIRNEWMREIDVQYKYMNFFQENIEILGKVGDIRAGYTGMTANYRDIVAGIDDKMANYYASNIASASQQHERILELLQDTETPLAARNKLRKEQEEIEQQIARSVNEATQYVAESNMNLTKGGNGERTMSVVTQGISRVSSATAKKTMGEGFKAAQQKAVQAGQLSKGNAIEQIAQAYNLRG